MPTTITAVTSLGYATETQTGGRINRPPLETFAGHHFSLDGWVLVRGVPPPAVEVCWNEVPLFVAPVDVSRPDVGAYYSEALPSPICGFSLAIDTLLLPEAFELVVSARLDDGSRQPLGSVSGTRSPFDVSFSPRLTPITIVGLPRSGTTLLMRYLSSHPAIVGNPVYPFEFMGFIYWAHAFRVLSAPADYLHSTHPDHFLSDSDWVGHHPFFMEHFGHELAAWFNTGYQTDLATFCLWSIESCYNEMAAAQHKSDVHFFVEKIHRTTATYKLFWSLYTSGHAVFIVRDFRDRFCSVLSFNRKRGYDGFYYEQAGSDLAYALQTRQEFMFWRENWRRHPDRVHLLRYEDLILQPRATLAQLFSALDLPLTDASLDQFLNVDPQDTPELAYHRTVEDAAKSIGRWKTELTPELQALYRAHFSDLLVEFGYEP